MPDATEPLRHEVRIAAPPEVVFPYFTDPTRLVAWMGIGAVLDPRPGGTFRIDVNGRDVVLGEYVEVRPPQRVVFTWGFDGADRVVAPGSSRVEVTLEPDGDGTRLVLEHHGLPAGSRPAHAEGWTHYVARLAAAAAAKPAGPGPVDRHLKGA